MSNTMYRCADCQVLVIDPAPPGRTVHLCCNCLHFPGWQHDERLKKIIGVNRCDPCHGTWLDEPLPQIIRDLARATPKKGVVA